DMVPNVASLPVSDANSPIRMALPVCCLQPCADRRNADPINVSKSDFFISELPACQSFRASAQPECRQAREELGAIQQDSTAVAALSSGRAFPRAAML